MKKLLFIITLITMSIIASAQSFVLKSSASHAATDTVDNTEAITQLGKVPGGGSVTIECLVTKISGTVAGQILFLASVTGVAYDTIQLVTSTGTLVNYPASSPTNVASQAFFCQVPPHRYSYFAVKYTGTGTMSAKMNSQAILK